jgi:hypothetical protein
MCGRGCGWGPSRTVGDKSRAIHQGCVLGLTRLHRHLDHVLGFSATVFFDIDAGDELQPIEFMKALDAARGSGLRGVVVGADIAG